MLIFFLFFVLYEPLLLTYCFTICSRSSNCTPLFTTYLITWSTGPGFICFVVFNPHVSSQQSCFIHPPPLSPPSMEGWDAALQKRLAWAMFCCYQPTFLCCHPTELIWAYPSPSFQVSLSTWEKPRTLSPPPWLPVRGIADIFGYDIWYVHHTMHMYLCGCV